MQTPENSTELPVAIPSTTTSAIVVDRVNKNAKVIGKRGFFHSTMSARDLRDYFKSTGLTGRAAKRAVNASLNGSSAVSWVRAQGAISALQSTGFVPDLMDQSRNGKVVTVRFVKPEVPAEKKIVVENLTLAEKAALLARLQKELETSKSPTINV